MTTLQNEILIKGKLEDIWNVLNTTEVLDQYDPTVEKSISTSEIKSGVGASRKVDMQDGKNWFEEKCTMEVCFYGSLVSFDFTHSGIYGKRRIGTNNRIFWPETLYLIIQFGLFAILLHLIWKKGKTI